MVKPIAESAVIFDVDGVLLQLTAAEVDIFFATFAPYCDSNRLSRNWNGYRIRNDDDIVDEIMATHGIAASLKTHLVNGYHETLAGSLTTGALVTEIVPGADELLEVLSATTTLGIATANFRKAARLRLQSVNLWHAVAAWAFGADGGGHKHEILARAIASLGLAPDRIVYVGDNLNDVEAGLRNGVHFIGFSRDSARRHQLAAAGASFTCGDHRETLRQVGRLLAA